MHAERDIVLPGTSVRLSVCLSNADTVDIIHIVPITNRHTKARYFQISAHRTTLTDCRSPTRCRKHVLDGRCELYTGAAVMAR